MNKVEGVVKFYNGNKGFGFITVKDSEDVFFHVSELKNSGCPDPRDGDRLSFLTREGKKGKLEAYEITMIG